MVTNSFGKRNSVQSMGRLNMHSWWTLFFHFEGGVGGIIFCVFPLFSMCYHHVPKCVPNDVPNSTSVLSHTVCPKFNCLVYKLKRSNPRVDICFYFATVVQRGASIGGMPNVPKTFADGPINMAPPKKIKKKVVSPNMIQLIWITL